jgi:hypothetical protein
VPGFNLPKLPNRCIQPQWALGGFVVAPSGCALESMTAANCKANSLESATDVGQGSATQDCNPAFELRLYLLEQVYEFEVDLHGIRRLRQRYQRPVEIKEQACIVQ